MKCICVCLGSLNLRSAQKACGSADNPGELHGRVRTHIHNTHTHFIFPLHTYCFLQYSHHHHLEQWFSTGGPPGWRGHSSGGRE